MILSLLPLFIRGCSPMGSVCWETHIHFFTNTNNYGHDFIAEHFVPYIIVEQNCVLRNHSYDLAQRLLGNLCKAQYILIIHINRRQSNTQVLHGHIENGCKSFHTDTKHKWWIREFTLQCMLKCESLFTLFASLTYAYHYLMTLIK